MIKENNTSDGSLPGGNVPDETELEDYTADEYMTDNYGLTNIKDDKTYDPDIPVRSWFVTLMCMNIPIVGWIYLLILSGDKKQGAKKDFAKAYLVYKLVFLLISILILGAAAYVGLEYLEKLLAYMEML